MTRTRFELGRGTDFDTARAQAALDNYESVVLRALEETESAFVTFEHEPHWPSEQRRRCTALVGR